ncbi:hypothetical protein KAU33_10860 [Candidatus Dependentiae bacterium]|nr:hypothetical protein [Candidatus Dependentiae bacterium]
MRKIILIFIFILFIISIISYTDSKGYIIFSTDKGSENVPNDEKNNRKIQSKKQEKKLYKKRVIIKEDAKVGIIDRGPYIANARFLGLYKEKINHIDIHDLSSRFFPSKKLRDFNLIIFPTGSLFGVENDIVLKYQLEKYVRNGGVLFCFTQQHGYEFSILPGGGVKGMGWREDEGDHIYSVYIDEYHQVLSNLTEYIVNIKVDGYFTSYPKDTVILLRRTKNNYPAMILYPFGKGYVIATTAYTDRNFGCMNLSHQEKNVYRDIISWSLKKDREKILSIKKEETVETSMDIDGPLNNSYIDSVVISISDPDRNIVNTMTFPISLVNGKATVPISYSTDKNSPPGIWWISYVLLHKRGFKIKRKIHGKRFTVEALHEIHTPDNLINLTVSAPDNNDSSKQKFIIKIKNDHNYDLVKHQLTIGKSNPVIEYPGKYWHNLFQKTITIPAKKEITINWTEENFDITNIYWFGIYKSWEENYSYSFPGSMKRARKSFWNIDPMKLEGLNINVTQNTNKNAYDIGETVTLTVYIKNNNPNIKPELYTEVKYAEFEERRSYKLDKLQTLVVNFPTVKGQPKVNINTYEKNTRSLIYKSFKYIRVCDTDLIIYTDKNCYNPGETINLTIITT